MPFQFWHQNENEQTHNQLKCHNDIIVCMSEVNLVCVCCVFGVYLPSGAMMQQIRPNGRSNFLFSRKHMRKKTNMIP